ncbi:fibronectin type III domain-containing protein [Paenibacillus sp. N4]|uniref:fibronectin type III domain-containing protein n=1 Tax=Paenibacillus vietnamensis TaxID=2590547 RepID=UPI001CD1375D|nr:fibronectin type III domain-containing protein [Paenibacillus vietnamensis]MCA0754254.1 fibronectin type III domain-containing protein [Paenibacillus vietnamensis]
MKIRRLISSILITAMLFALLPAVHVSNTYASGTLYFFDDFEGGLSDKWDIGDPARWTQVTDTSRNSQVLRGNASVTPKTAIVKAAQMPRTSTDYIVEYWAKSDDRYRTYFRYADAFNFYFLEFRKDTTTGKVWVSCWKQQPLGTQAVGSSVDITAAVGVLDDWKAYKLAVVGNAFTLYIDHQQVANYTDSSVPAGGAGFGLKALSSSATTNVWLDQVRIYEHDIEPPAAPANLTASEITDISARLDWDPAVDNIGIDGYEIWKNGVLTDTVPGAASGYTAGGLAPETSYSFTVRALDIAGNASPYSGEAVVTTLVTTDLTPPTAPGNLTVTGQSSTSAALSWQPASDNVGVTGYEIYKNDMLLTTVAGNVHDYSAVGLLPATAYQFVVKARDAVGQVSEPSNPVTVTTDEVPLTIAHTPITETYYYKDVPLQFAVSETGSPVSGILYYRYGNRAYQEAVLTEEPGKLLKHVVPGSNSTSTISYYIEASDAEGRHARYPESGTVTINVHPFESYFNSFDEQAPGTIPAGWTFSDPSRIKVVDLGDGNQALHMPGAPGLANLTARLSDPAYGSIDSFTIKFKAKYAKVGNEYLNIWRMRYRAQDANNNNSLEWGSHNSKYFIMRKTTLGGNYYVANYINSLENTWHDYELQVSGITHRLLIDGLVVMEADDADAENLLKGYLEFGTVIGIDLYIDDFSVEKLAVPYIYKIQPAGDYSGIYSSIQTPGLDITIDSKDEGHVYKVDYNVYNAQGEKELLRSGSKSYTLNPYESATDTLLFDPPLQTTGTYEIVADFFVDDIKIADKTKRMRFSVVDKHADVAAIDLDMESKFGFNTHYSLNWRDDIIDGMRKAGARHHRSHMIWQAIEKAKGVYDFSEFDVYLNKLSSFGFNSIQLLDMKSNPVYQNDLATSREALQGMSNFVETTANRYKGSIRHWEMPNEPELTFHPGSFYIPEELVDMQRAAYIGLKKADPDAVLIAGDHTSSVLSVLPRELAVGSYYYSDAYSYHPYIYDAMPETKLRSFIDGVKNLVNEYGGWKDYYITEGGWPTAKSGYPNVTEEFQRDYIIRSFLIDMISDQVKVWEYYDYKNDGSDESHYDIFWGITDTDGRPKLAYNGVHTLMTTLDRVHYAGRLNTGDDQVEAHVFIKDYEPIVVAWKHVSHKDNPAVVSPTAVLTIPVSTDQVTVKDVNGNESAVQTQNGTVNVTVSGSPVYITGTGRELVYSSAQVLLADKYAESAAKITAMQTADNGAAIESDLQQLAAIKSSVDGGLAHHTLGGKAGRLKQAIVDVYALMSELATQIKQGEAADAKAYVAMEALYNYAEAVSKALIQVKGSEDIQSVELDFSDKAQAATTAYSIKKGQSGLMPVSTAAVMRMNRYGRLAGTNNSRGDFAEAYVYNFLAREFAAAAEAIVGAEQVKPIPVLLYVSSYLMSGEAGFTSNLDVSLTNHSAAAQEVVTAITLPDGWDDVQTQSMQWTEQLQAGSYTDRQVPIQIPGSAEKGTYEVTVETTVDGVPIESKVVKITVDDAIAAKILPVTKSIDQLTEVTVQLTGISPHGKNGKVVLTGPDGTPLEPVDTDTFTNLQQGQTITRAFKWTYGSINDFNSYRNQLRIIDSGTGEDMFSDNEALLDFTIVQKAGTIVIDGELDDWKDAYPIHLRGAARNNNGVYDKSNLSAVAYQKWDEENYYIAVEVTDNIHKNSEDASNMWKNDSLQVSFDPLNDKGGSYGSDDMEWGFSMNDTGALHTIIFKSNSPNPNGNVTGQVPFQAVRDENSKKTFYEIRIPKTMIHDLQPQLDRVIGINFAINDADFQNGRDNFLQWTLGLADSKNPGLYDSFTMINVEVSPDPGETGIIQLPKPTIGTNGALIAEVSRAVLEKAIEGAGRNRSPVVINIPETDGAARLIVKMPAQPLRSAKAREVGKLEIVSGMAKPSIAIDSLRNAIKTKSQQLELSIEMLDPEQLEDPLQDRLQNKPVYQFQFSVDGKETGNLAGKAPINIAVPYTLQPGEQPGRLVMYNIRRGSGGKAELKLVKDSSYNTETGELTFIVKQFGIYTGFHR